MFNVLLFRNESVTSGVLSPCSTVTWLYLVVVLQSGGGGRLLLLAACQSHQELLLLHLRRCLLETLQSLKDDESQVMLTAPRMYRHRPTSSLCAVTHLLTLPVGQVTLPQHEATGADVHLTPGTNQPHVLLHAEKHR